MGEQKILRQSRPLGIGAWEPFHIGDPARYLYAGLHRAEAAGARLGVLLVPPLFHEQPRSRRLLTEVASGLAAVGLPSLRFDFFGTGDSGGSGEEADFASMRADIQLAGNALRAETGVRRIAVLAWRGAALPVATWLAAGGNAAVVVLWEPILDGAAWLTELESQDVAERCSQQRYRLGRGVAAPGIDDQLMGQPVSQRLRRDIVETRLAADARMPAARTWTVVRPGTQTSPITVERRFLLPADMPTFGGSTRMDQALFVSPRLQPVIDELGRALAEVD